MRRILFVFLLLLSVSVTAQSPAPPADTAPTLSEIDALKLQNLELRRQIVQRAVDDWTTAARALKAELESARPGWTIDLTTGTWTKVPATKEKEKGPEPPSKGSGAS